MKIGILKYFIFFVFFASIVNAQWRQLGNKIVDTTGNATFASRYRGLSVCISPDGSTLIGASTYSTKGAWIYSISGGNFIKVASIPILRDTIHSINVVPGMGQSVSIASDNKTYVIGYPTREFIVQGPYRLFFGSASVYTVKNDAFGPVGSEVLARDTPNGDVLSVLGLGKSVSISGDGKTVIVGADGTDIYSPDIGNAWIYTFNGINYEQLGEKLKGNGTESMNSNLGYSVGMSRDGKTAIVGGVSNANSVGAAWIFTFNGHNFVQFGDKLTGADHTGQSQFGNSVSISADGKTAVVGGYADSSLVGAFWVYTFNGTSFVQLGKKLVASDYIKADQTHTAPWQGTAVAISGNGKTIVVGARLENNYKGAAWIYSFNGTNFVQASPRLVGSGWEGLAASQGNSVSISDDGTKVAVAGYADNYGIGAVWVYVLCSPPKITSMCLDSNNILTVNAASDFPMQYQWFIESIPLTKTTMTVPGFDITATISASGGRYSCIVTNGCSSATSPDVQQNDLIGRRILGDFTLCQGDSSHLLANDMESITWSTGENTNSISFLPKGNVTISFAGINNQSCPVKGMFTITINSAPNISLDLSPINQICDTLGTIELTGGSPAKGAYLYLDTQVPDNKLDISKEGMYPITYSITAENNCVGSVTDTLYVIHCVPPTACELPNPPCTCPGRVCPLNFKVYTGFTPNGDGINETLVIDSLTANNKLSILDKWGNEVYNAVDYKNEWIGINKDGKQLPDGVYYYYYVPNGDSRKKSSGSVSIIH